tara:strand:- start:87 stop:449 length:363 start_codon:yes stop_codon:yes gene_type:complete
MKKIILSLIILFSTFTYSQTLRDFEGIWSTPHSFIYRVFTFNEEDEILEVYVFSFGDDSAIVEKIVKIDNNSVYTKLYNYDNKWKVKIEYNIIGNKLYAVYSGDVKTSRVYNKATLILNN